MRKFVLVLVAALATTAMASAPYVTLEAGPTAADVNVVYHSDATEANLPSGFGLTISVSDGNIVSVSNLNADYNIYPGTIDINATTGVVDDAGSPVVGSLPAASIILEMGALYERGVDPAPAASATLCTITVDTTCTVTVAGDDARAGNGMGIVAQDYTAYPVSDTLGVTLATDCLYVGKMFANGLTVTQTMVDKWTTLGKPACWCCEAQKYGNGIFTGASGNRVDTTDLGSLKLAWLLRDTQTGYLPCVDFNLSGRIDTVDLGILKLNWLTRPGYCE